MMVSSEGLWKLGEFVQREARPLRSHDRRECDMQLKDIMTRNERLAAEVVERVSEPQR